MGEAKNKKAAVFHAFPCNINRYLLKEKLISAKKSAAKCPKSDGGKAG